MKGMAILCAVMVFTLAACGGSGGTPAADSEVQREADTYAIDQTREDVAQGGVDAGRRPDDEHLGA